MSHTITLRTPAQADSILSRAAEWIRRRVSDGRAVVLTLEDERRSLPQNHHIHPVVRRLAKALGRPTDEESLRRLRYLLLEQWRHETGRNPMFERSIDGLRWVSVDKGTSDLDKPDCSEFIDWLIEQESA